MPTLDQEFADILAKQITRPFDSRIKSVLREPGVLENLWKDYCRAPIIEISPSDVPPPPLLVANDAQWLAEEYRTSQVTFRSDTVASYGNVIVHLEQQTKHEPLPMLRRMAEYAGAISSFYRFRKQLYQVYYYTGDDTVRWDRGTQDAAFVSNSNFSFKNKFLFIDAGDHDTERMLQSENFDYALLGLLSRTASERLFARLVEMAYAKFGHDSHTLHAKLVNCIVISSLRGNASCIWRLIDMKDQRQIKLTDPFFQKLRDEQDHISRELALEIFHLVNRISKERGFEFTDEFLEWAPRFLTEHQAMALNENYPFSHTPAELLEDSGIDWPPPPALMATLGKRSSLFR